MDQSFKVQRSFLVYMKRENCLELQKRRIYLSYYFRTLAARMEVEDVTAAFSWLEILYYKDVV
jgi:hypothetical protein